MLYVTDYGHHRNLELLGLGRHFGLKFYEAFLAIFGRTISTHFGTAFFIIRPLFLQKTKPELTSKYLLFLDDGFEFGPRRT